MTERQGCRGDGISIRIPTADPYPWGSPWGSPYPRQSPGLPWGRNFYPHIYLPHTHTHGDLHGDLHTHGRVQGCRGDRISIPIYTYPIPIPMGIPMGIPTPTADLLNVHRVVLLDATRPSTGTSPSRSAARRRGHGVLPVRAAARRLAASADISCRRADRPTWRRSARSGATGNRRFVGRRDVTRPRDVRDE